MEKQPKKTAESVKAGLQIEGDVNPSDINTAANESEEKDADELVHMPKNELVDDTIEQDLDQVVHEQTGGITTAADVLNKEIDGDDAVHEK